MLHNYNKWKVLQVFFDEPLAEGGHQLREISRKVKLAPLSVKNYLLELKSEELVLEKKSRVQSHPTYWANRESELFLLYKKTNTILKIKESGLLDYLYDSCLPTAIILFGSAARGEDTEQSDIDLFLQASQTKLNLTKYEKILKREINLFFEENFLKLSKELKNNLLNGMILKGYLKVF
ncbi:MAG TPA: nucleotidyltransferase domain-containing protein [Candidatus Nanoarchaeia archaeon]|nr:nucleotidyltransferase domain-containing protein [Candidatus Nanoarchaeia archaeon]